MTADRVVTVGELHEDGSATLRMWHLAGGEDPAVAIATRPADAETVWSADSTGQAYELALLQPIIELGG